MAKKTKALYRNESGFAPLIITIVIVTILILLTLSFVELMRSNQYNGLNKQLNSDAYYAAESGINDAIEALHAGFDQPKTTCGPIAQSAAVPGSQYLDNNHVSGNQDLYSCLLINSSPDSLRYGSVGTNNPTVAIITGVGIHSGNVHKIGYLKVSWQPSSAMGSSPYNFATPPLYTSCGNGPCLPKQNAWSETNAATGKVESITGILRLGLTAVKSPTPHSGTIPSDTKSTYTAFLYPAAGNGSDGLAPSYDSSSNGTTGANSGEVVGGECANNNSSQPDACNVVLDVRHANTSTFILELRSIYAATTVTISAYAQYPQNVLFIKNAQTLIDSTGDDHGVLKRIQVRIPTLDYVGMPSFDIESKQSICKNLEVYPTNQSTGNSPGNATSTCGL